MIETVDDFLDLARSEVGEQGYYFRQMTDLNIRKISTWPKILFQGFYDGQGYYIEDGESRGTALFQTIKDSKIERVNLNQVVFSRNSENCKFIACNQLHITSAQGCIFLFCQNTYALLNEAINCQIKFCQGGSSLVWNFIEKSLISDCLIILDGKRTSNIVKIGGISKILNNTLVERCFVTGKWDGWVEFSGIACSIKNASSVRNCALGDFKLTGSNIGRFGRIAREKDESSILENNVAIDSFSTTGWEDGESVAAVRFNQRYFEHTLNWNFHNVWTWDEKKNHPVLRQVGVQAFASHTFSAHHADSAQANTADLLTQQIRANIWL